MGQMIYVLYVPDKVSKEVLDLKSDLTSGDVSFGWRRRKLSFFFFFFKEPTGVCWAGVGLMGYVSNILYSTVQKEISVRLELQTCFFS